MEKLLKPGRSMFAIGIIALGILCMISKDFIVGRPPAWPERLAFNPILGYISGGLLIVAGIAILLKKKEALSALLIAALILLLSVLRHLPQFTNDWLNAYKALALFGGALIVACSFFKDDESVNSGFSVNDRWMMILTITGCVLLAVFFIASGYAHFKFAEFVKMFIPAYIPFHGFWAYACGVFLIAGGAGLLISFTRRWAALLTGIMIGGWFLLLHIPRFIANTSDPSDRMGLLESFTFAGILFVLAGMLSRKTGK